MASGEPERKIRKRKAPASSVSPVKKISVPAAGKGRGKKEESKEEKIMADENQPAEGAAIPPQAEEEVRRGAANARKAAENLRSAAGAVADQYRGRAEEVWQDASSRVRTFQDDTEQYVRDNPTKAVLTALGVGFVLGLIFRR
jgi:ElaB/YqjD/DUF883 family membrane-anchored ribosome-binding protein